MEIETERDARALGINVKNSGLGPLTVGKTKKEVFGLLVEEIREEILDRVKEPSEINNLGEIKAFRRFYWSIGIDPTRTRPSSEALVRRLFRKGIPMINTMVDAGNLASARTLIPIGLYDIDRINGEIMIRLSRNGETFTGIGSEQEVLAEGVPVLSDQTGIIHLYPHRDCMRTRITGDTERVLMIACGVKGIGDKRLEGSLEQVKRYFRDLSG